MHLENRYDDIPSEEIFQNSNKNKVTCQNVYCDVHKYRCTAIFAVISIFLP